jgi:hypothetical protein
MNPIHVRKPEFPNIHFMPTSSKLVSSLEDFQHKICTLLSSPCILHVPSISRPRLYHPKQYLMKSENSADSHCALFFAFPPFHRSWIKTFSSSPCSRTEMEESAFFPYCERQGVAPIQNNRQDSQDSHLTKDSCLRKGHR